MILDHFLLELLVFRGTLVHNNNKAILLCCCYNLSKFGLNAVDEVDVTVIVIISLGIRQCKGNDLRGDSGLLLALGLDLWELGLNWLIVTGCRYQRVQLLIVLELPGVDQSREF